ncbi:MAG: hypothetical protein WA952_16175, partial [Lewinella sp.]
SLRLQSSGISEDHFLIEAARQALPNAKLYGSPTLSDQALMPFPTLKLGPGDSARSHSADEFIWVEEVLSGTSGYAEVILGCRSILSHRS